MGSCIDRVVQLCASVLICAIATVPARVACAQQQAVTATVIGEKVQKVGYRAMIQKQAIMYNLAGFARNNPDGTVGLELQGDEARIAKTLEAVSAGNKNRRMPISLGKHRRSSTLIWRRSLSTAGRRPAETSQILTIWFST